MDLPTSRAIPAPQDWRQDYQKVAGASRRDQSPNKPRRQLSEPRISMTWDPFLAPDKERNGPSFAMPERGTSTSLPALSSPMHARARHNRLWPLCEAGATNNSLLCAMTKLPNQDGDVISKGRNTQAKLPPLSDIASKSRHLSVCPSMTGPKPTVSASEKRASAILPPINGHLRFNVPQYTEKTSRKSHHRIDRKGNSRA